jgi:UDP-N-acetylmuramate dehydrogenase
VILLFSQWGQAIFIYGEKALLIQYIVNMSKDPFEAELDRITQNKVVKNEPLSQHTTMGVGGPAEYFCTVTSEEELAKLLMAARKYRKPVLVIGGGSNIIVSDKGIEGLVIKMQLLGFEKLEKPEIEVYEGEKIVPRLTQLSEKASYKAEKDANIDDEAIYVKVGSGWKLGALIQKLLSLNISGLEWFSGIPASVGGAVYMNLHGGHKFFSDFVVAVDVLTQEGEARRYLKADMEFDYDCSMLHENKDVVTSVMLKLHKGCPEKSRKIIQEWGGKKITNQPQRSAGCVFQNLTKEQQHLLDLPTPSIGYIIDNELHLSGKSFGGARISLQHAGFVENLKDASAEDVKMLVELVEKKFEERYKFKLKREVEFIGDFT